MHPEFDYPESAMPELMIPKSQSDIIANFLIQERGFWDKIKDRIQLGQLSLIKVLILMLASFITGLFIMFYMRRKK